MLTDIIEVTGQALVSGGPKDTRTGNHVRRVVAVKTLRVVERDDSRRIREVGIFDDLHVSVVRPDQFALAVRHIDPESGAYGPRHLTVADLPRSHSWIFEYIMAHKDT